MSVYIDLTDDENQIHAYCWQKRLTEFKPYCEHVRSLIHWDMTPPAALTKVLHQFPPESAPTASLLVNSQPFMGLGVLFLLLFLNRIKVYTLKTILPHSTVGWFYGVMFKAEDRSPQHSFSPYTTALTVDGTSFFCNPVPGQKLPLAFLVNHTHGEPNCKIHTYIYEDTFFLLLVSTKTIVPGTYLSVTYPTTSRIELCACADPACPDLQRFHTYLHSTHFTPQPIIF